MKTAPRVLGSLSLLAAFASIGLQFAVVARLWAAFVETIPLTSTIALSAAASILGLALALTALVFQRGSFGILVPVAGLMNAGLVAAYAYLFAVI